MVVNGDGLFVDDSGSSRGISTRLDQRQISRLRALSDVIVTGGATARAEGYEASKHAPVAVISHQTYQNADLISLIPPSDSVVPTWVIEHLKELGYDKILLEVGPSLAKEFLESNLVDEFLLTVTNGSLTVANQTQKSLGGVLSLVDSEEVGDTLFTKWRRGNE